MLDREKKQGKQSSGGKHPEAHEAWVIPLQAHFLLDPEVVFSGLISPHKGSWFMRVSQMEIWTNPLLEMRTMEAKI